MFSSQELPAPARASRSASKRRVAATVVPESEEDEEQSDEEEEELDDFERLRRKRSKVLYASFLWN